MKRRQTFQPQKRCFAVWMTIFVGLNDLCRGGESYNFQWPWVFNTNSGTIGHQKSHEKRFCFHSEVIAFLRQLSRLGVHPSGSGLAHVGTRWMGDNHIPLDFQDFKSVRPKMILRVSTTTLYKVTTISLVSNLPKCVCHSLAFFASHKHSHITALPSNRYDSRVCGTKYTAFCSCGQGTGCRHPHNRRQSALLFPRRFWQCALHSA